MSDDILSVNTLFPDVASLAQGYINRVDGERLLLPLPVDNEQGDGVRFVVYLADGTAAFAGAGRCVQVSDQGEHVPPDTRFETLLDALVFDERSQPVYDYIVAVRNAAYGADEGAAPDAGQAQLEPVEEEIAVEPSVEVEAEVDAKVDAEIEPELAATTSDDADAEAEVEVEPAPSDEPDDEPSYAQPSYEEALEQPSVAEPTSEAESAQVLSVPAAPALVPSAAPISYRPDLPSFVPEAVPTGMLKRPALALHWQPDRPRRPTPRPHTGMFRYPGPGLPVPPRPPRPELDPERRVRPAARPTS